ncbi:MAG: FAD-binding protein [bacterium]
MFNERRIEKNIKLAEYTTFKIGGNAKYFFIAKNEKDVLDILKWTAETKEKIFILGGGSNLLFRDKGFNGVVIKMEMRGDIKIKEEGEKNVVLSISAGCKFFKLIDFCRDNFLSGTEWASGIPGITVGGAIKGNAGAFGVSMDDIVDSVRAIKLVKSPKFVLPACADRSAAEGYKVQSFEMEKITKLSNKECKFKYRSSIFKEKGNFIILSAELKFKKGNKDEIVEKIKSYAKFRKEKQPLVFRNAGSIFKNVSYADFTHELGSTPPLPTSKGELDVAPAGWLIDKCGLKGKKIGGAMISEKHANIIVNLGKAKAKDVIDLMELAEMDVKKKFGVKLEREIEVV